MRARWIVVLALITASCSDRQFVANQTASHHWHIARYEHECTVVSPQQRKFKEDVNEQLRQTRIAAEVTAIGKLPREAKKSMRAQAKKVKEDTCTASR